MQLFTSVLRRAIAFPALVNLVTRAKLNTLWSFLPSNLSQLVENVKMTVVRLEFEKRKLQSYELLAVEKIINLARDMSIKQVCQFVHQMEGLTMQGDDHRRV